MDRVFYDDLKIVGEKYKHLAKVRRYKVGEKIELVKDGRVFLARVSEITKDAMMLEIIKELEARKDFFKIHVFQGIVEKKKFEDVLRINSMLGVSEFIPVKTSRIKVTREIDFNTDRNKAILEESAELSKSVSIPSIGRIMTFSEAIDYAQNFDLNMILYEDEDKKSMMDIIANYDLKNKSTVHIGIFVGPEGGFEPKEVDLAKSKNIISARIFSPIVRTEYAAFSANSIIRALLEEVKHES